MSISKKVRIAAISSILCILITPRISALRPEEVGLGSVGEYSSDNEQTDEIFYTPEDFDADSILDSLPEEVKNLLPDEGLFDSDKAIESFGVGYFAQVVLGFLAAALRPAIRTFSSLMGLVMISSALGALRGSARSDSLSSVFDFSTGLCIMLSLYGTISRLFDRVRNYLSVLGAVMSSMVPVMTGVAVAGGNLSAAVVSSNGMLLGLNAVETLATAGLVPILQLCFGMAVASGLGSKLKLGGISKLIRGAFTWVMGLCAAAISAVMSFQTMIAARADSLSMRAVKFAVAGAIPVAGGIAGDAVRTVAGSLSLVRSTVGWVGVVIILLLTLPVIIEVVLARLGVAAAGTAADVLGLERERGLLDELVGLLGFLTAVLVISSLMFIYALAVFSRGAAALAGS